MTNTSANRAPRSAAGWVLAVAAAALVGLPDARAEDPLANVDSVDAFAEVFDAGKGAPRVVVLLSPT